MEIRPEEGIMSCVTKVYRVIILNCLLFDVLAASNRSIASILSVSQEDSLPRKGK